MPSDFSSLIAGADRPIELSGWISPFESAAAASYFALIEEAPCCIGCLPRDPMRRIEVFAREPIPVSGCRVRLQGRLVRPEGDAAGWRLQLHDAVLLAVEVGQGGMSRRRVLSAMASAGMFTGLSAGLAACTTAASGDGPAAGGVAPAAGIAQARAALAGFATTDVHSHAGGLIGVARVESGAPFTPVAAPMREGGMAVLCLAIVSDSPVHRVMADHRIHPFRDPAPGELHAYGQRSFERLHALVQAQQLGLISSAEQLDAARSDRPSVIVSAEGGDFLEGRVERVDEAQARWQLRHLQLTHYRVNELGDIQTEPPVHGGLTATGAAVIRRCNQLGIVVDVAHAPYGMVKQAAEVATRPLVLSHTSLAAHPGARSRQITPEHARVVAQTGGLIGIWPPASIFPDFKSLAAGIARMADTVGVQHVALGSDMRGLVGPSTFGNYRDLPLLAQALLDRGFSNAELRQILGGNYGRVFRQCMAVA